MPMQKRSVLFINDSLCSGSGVFRSLQQILRCISYEKYDVTVFVYPGGEVDADMPALLPKEIKVVIGRDDLHPYRNPSVAALYALYRAANFFHLKNTAETLDVHTRIAVRRQKNKATAKKYFSRQPYDVLIANTVPKCSEIAHEISAKKKYAVFHSSRAEFFPKATKAALARFDGMIAVSEGVRQVLLKAYPAFAHKIRTITNYVDGGAIRERAREKDLLPHSDTPVICSCGRLSREKGFDLAVEAAKVLRDKGYDFIWYFVGDGSERQKLAGMVEQYDLQQCIVFTGFMQNPYPYIGNCDIYVQPSYEEAQPLSVMEAQILGRAIVSTRTVGGETILQDGACGVLTPISAAELAQGIETLLTNPAYRASLENQYTQAEDQRNQREFASAWDRLLSE